MKNRSIKTHYLGSVSAICVSLLFAMSPANLAYAQDDSGEQSETTTTEEGEARLDVVVVSGYRQSLEKSLGLKRGAVNNRESIVAEDIGKMPDLNLAESIQRVPGITIEREGGEGRKVNIRGLGPEFTRVTLNGMEVPASTGGLDSSGGVNRGRSFDFNVFSSDLFNRIDIHKAPTAAIEEGGVAGTVELYSARPLDRSGFNATVSAQGSYNDLTEELSPRLSASIGNTNEAETFGFLLSAAYSERAIFQDGFGTVRWAQPDRDFAGFAGATVNGTAADASINDLWYPRLPRQDSFRQYQDRLGVSGAVEFEPTSRMKFGANWLYSQFNSDLDAYNSFFQFRRSGGYGYPTITPVSVTTDASGLIALQGTFDNVGLRTESRQQLETTTFNQLTADFQYDITDNLTLKAMIGQASSKFEQDYFRVNIETPTGGRFTYDFTSDSDVASLAYDQDVSNPANFYVMTNDRIEKNIVDRENKTARVDLTWQLGDGELKFGGILNDRDVDSRVDGGININDQQSDLASISNVFSYVDYGGYGNSTLLDFVTLDFGAARQAFNVGDYSTLYGAGRQTWMVGEKTMGAYVDYTHTFDPVTINVGGRIVKTETTSRGYADPTGAAVVDFTNEYTEFLPSANLVWEVTPDVLFRLGASRTLTRAGLSSIAPIRSYSDVNFTVSGGNPDLKPQFSDNIDASIEYYMGDSGLLALSVFSKDLSDLIDSENYDGPLSASDRAAVAVVYPTQPGLLDPNQTGDWSFSLPGNTASATLNGFEIAVQRDFDFLPGLLANTGIQANYTYLDGEAEDASGNKGPITGLSENSWNATIFYEEPEGRYGARVSVNSRDDYLTRIPGGNGNFSEATTGPTQFDFASFYNVSDSLTVTFEVINVNDRAERLYTTGDGSMDLVREINDTGRQIFLGVRKQF